MHRARFSTGTGALLITIFSTRPHRFDSHGQNVLLSDLSMQSPKSNSFKDGKASGSSSVRCWAWLSFLFLCGMVILIWNLSRIVEHRVNSVIRADVSNSRA
jgi:hypothetical protein